MKRSRPHKYFLGIVALLSLLSTALIVLGQKPNASKRSFKKCWEYASEEIITVEDGSDNGLIFLTSLPDTIQTLNLQSSKTLWKSSLGGKIISAPIINGNALVVLNESATVESGSVLNGENGAIKRSLVSLDSVSGITNWRTDANSTGKISLHGFGNMLVSVEAQGIINLIDPQDGKTRQRFDLKEEISAIHQFNDTLALGTVGKKVLFFSIAAGKITKEFSVEEAPTKIFASDSEHFVWADRKGVMRFVNAAYKKPVWKKRFGGAVSSVTKASSNKILISSFDNFIYLVEVNSGRVKWKKRLAGRIITEPLAFENLIVAFAYGESTGLILDLTNGKVIDLLTLSDTNDHFTGKAIYTNNFLIFPTLKGLVVFSDRECSQNKETGK